jgi:thioredoxin reductase/TM2 domain-containing membrane protein YozV
MFRADRELARYLYRERLKRKRSLYLSLLFPGLGQIYQGRVVSGLLFALIFLFPFYYLYLIGELLSYGGITLLSSQLILYLLQLYDAYRGSKRESSPCEDFCPAGVLVPTFMSLCERGEFEKAFASFLSKAPFPFTLGEICPAECEKRCGVLPERPLKIREVHRELGKLILEKAEVKEREPFFPPSGKKVAVIGGGVAGLTVAYYLASCGVEVELFEREEELGGTLNYIPPFKLNRELFKREVEFITSFKNIKLRLGEEIRERPSGFELVVACVGSQVEKRLPVEAPGLIYPLSFLKNPPPLKGKKVLVIGAGDTAFDVARLTARSGGKAVVLYRGSRKEVRAYEKEVREALKEGVELRTGCTLKEVKDGRAVFNCGSFDYDYLVPAIGFKVDGELLSSLKPDFITGDASNGMSSAVEAVGKARETAYLVLKRLGLGERAWFMEDFYAGKPEKPEGGNLFIVSESSLCQHCGIRVRS